ncbi:histidine phosphatase family protein [Agromyces arachidis]|uniref:histidine phosphatase family protein n=1 Tax=Agromyces arachidis TaxID=766966 RepID=UPI004055BA6A
MGRRRQLDARPRARETAEILSRGLDLPLGGTYEDLVEQDFGAAEGTLVAEIDARWPGRAFPGKEADEHVGPRGLRGLERVAAEHAGARVLAVAHGTLVRHVLAEISGHDARHYPRLDNLSMSELQRADAAWEVLTVGGAPFAEVRDGLDAAADLVRLAG